MTTDGEVWVWRIDIKTCQPRSTVRSSARPLLLSMRNRTGSSGSGSGSAASSDSKSNEAECAVRVERAELDPQGMPVLRCRSPGESQLFLVPCVL